MQSIIRNPVVFAIAWMFALAGCVSSVSTPTVQPEVPTLASAGSNERTKIYLHLQDGANSLSWENAWRDIGKESTDWDVMFESPPVDGDSIRLRWVGFQSEPGGPWVLSIFVTVLSLGTIPTYTYTRHPGEAHLDIWRNGVLVRQGVLKSRFTTHLFIWLPFAVRGPKAARAAREQDEDEGREAVVRDILAQARAFLRSPGLAQWK